MKPAKFFILAIGLLCIGTMGCKKQSRKWLIGEVHVYDAITGQPIQTKIVLDYGYNPLIGEIHYASRDLGKTDATGRFTFEESVSRRNVSHTLKIQKPTYYHRPTPNFSYEERSLKVKANNLIEVGLVPKYPFFCAW